MTTYNGWPNRFTWQAYNHISSDETFELNLRLLRERESIQILVENYLERTLAGALEGDGLLADDLLRDACAQIDIDSLVDALYEATT